MPAVVGPEELVPEAPLQPDRQADPVAAQHEPDQGERPDEAAHRTGSSTTSPNNVAIVVPRARAAGYQALYGYILADNADMLQLAERLGFRELSRDGSEVVVMRSL